MVKVNEDEKILIVELYKSGRSTSQIARHLQVSRPTVSRWLHRQGVTLRGPRETSTKCQLRHDAFDELTVDSAYWIGFLFADGSVVACRGETLRVQARISERLAPRCIGRYDPPLDGEGGDSSSRTTWWTAPSIRLEPIVGSNARRRSWRGEHVGTMSRRLLLMVLPRRLGRGTVRRSRRRSRAWPAPARRSSWHPRRRGCARLRSAPRPG